MALIGSWIGISSRKGIFFVVFFFSDDVGDDDDNDLLNGNERLSEKKTSVSGYRIL